MQVKNITPGAQDEYSLTADAKRPDAGCTETAAPSGDEISASNMHEAKQGGEGQRLTDGERHR